MYADQFVRESMTQAVSKILPSKISTKNQENFTSHWSSVLKTAVFCLVNFNVKLGKKGSPPFFSIFFFGCSGLFFFGHLHWWERKRIQLFINNLN